MLRRAWKPVLATAAVSAPAYYYYRYHYSTSSPSTFNLSVRERGPDGKSMVVKKPIPLLSKDEVEARLHEHASHKTTLRPDGVKWQHATAFLASNDPVEDANDSAIITRDASDPSAPGDLLFFAVMDGHAGYHTSRLLSKVLIPAVTLELEALVKGDAKASFTENIKAMIWPTSSSTIAPHADPERVSQALQKAFLNLDFELINSPIALLAANIDKISRDTKTIPDLREHPMAMATVQPAINGSCAIMAMIDTAHQNLYVASTGDSRAVAGVYEESEGGEGAWRVEVLSEDQTGRNPNELKRMQAEHPPDEAVDVIRNGRVLGGLEPTRAFGDASYKWPREVQRLIAQAYFADKPPRGTPTLLKTPPYVTARPEVTHRKLSFLPLSSDSSAAPKSTLRFLVLATDGLWDELTSTEVVALVAGHLAGLRGTVPKARLAEVVPTTVGTREVNKGRADSPKDGALDGAWAFEDENVCTHLIRNAFGGADEKKLRELVSIPAPHSRRYRDDVTVSVVWWEDGREEAARTATFAAEPPKPRL